MRGCCLPASAIYFLSGGVWGATILVLLTVGLASNGLSNLRYVHVHTRTQVSYIMEPYTTRKNYKSPRSLRSSRPQQTVPNASYFFFLVFFLGVTNYEIVRGDDEMVLELTADLHKWTTFFTGNDGPKITAILDLGWIPLKQSRGNNGNIAVALLWGGGVSYKQQQNNDEWQIL